MSNNYFQNFQNNGKPINNNSESFIGNYFKNLIQAFFYPLNKLNIIDTFSLLIVSAVVLFIPFGAFFVELLLFSCAIVYFRRRIQGNQREEEKEHIFGYAFKVFLIVLILEILKLVSILIISFTNLVHSATFTSLLFGQHFMANVYIIQCIVELVLYFFLVPFFISFSRRKNLYFETEDFIRSAKLIKEKFLLLFLTYLPYIVVVTIQTFILCKINVFYPASQTKVIFSVISRIIHDYMFLFTFVLAAQMYLSELDNKFDFSLKFDRKRIKKR